MIIYNNDIVTKILQATKHDINDVEDGKLGFPGQLVVERICCKRAFIRGAYLLAGSMSNPKKAYHLEFVTEDLNKAEKLAEIIGTFSIDAKIIKRKKNYVAYIKEGSQIVDLLNVMEAHVALMDLENVRILKEMRNQVNRHVNCEAANISKTVEAASKQIEDILFIRDHIGFENLAENLREIARLRIEYPEASLRELGTMLSPSIGKSGVNHRLRKLSMIADYYREHKEESLDDKKKIVINIPNGLEARPVAMLVQVASQYESSIYLESDDKKVNAKSIMGMMSLGLASGETVVVTADGPDEEKAIENIEKFLSGK